MGDL
jgi:RNA-splicing ligase RtcB